jgi:hypothetical protein
MLDVSEKKFKLQKLARHPARDLTIPSLYVTTKKTR